MMVMDTGFVHLVITQIMPKGQGRLILKHQGSFVQGSTNLHQIPH